MRLNEIEMSDHPDYNQLRANLLKPGTIEVSSSSYSRGKIALGDLEKLGAGHIVRKRDRNGDLEQYGFDYFREMNGDQLQATLKIDQHTLEPGQSFTENY